MKIIDAFWEQRNLGVTCYEISIGAKETVDEIKKAYHNIEERQYMVVKIPSENYNAVSFFQEKDYVFIETAFTMIHHLRHFPLRPRLQVMCERCSWEAMTEQDIEEMHHEIEKGIFKTDRVYCDPFFSTSQAKRRYHLWLQDQLNDGAIPYKVLYQGETVGFFCGSLAGAYSKFEGDGSGLFVQYSILASQIRAGARKCEAHISGNNPAVLRIDQELGYTVKKMEYVLIKHKL